MRILPTPATMAGRLPPELIIEIARHLDLCQDVLFFSPSRRRVNVTTLEVLAQVCRNWRNALIGCSRLWTTFRLYPYTGKLWSYPFHVQRWLQRAGPLGLDITISDFYIRALPYQLLYVPDLYYILDTITPFYKTWRLLELSLPLEQYRPLFNMYAPELRMLEELRLSFSAESWFNGLAIYTFINAPLLTCVELCSRICIFLPLLDYIRFPYHQLTTLVCENVFSSDPTFINHILRAATKLQYARLELVTNDNFDDAASAYYLFFRPFATCPNLLKLEITSQGLCDASFVLAGLTAPALKELRLKHYGKIVPAGDFDLILEAFQKRSQAPLRVVHFRHLHNLDENGPGLVPFLELVGETLKELIIESCTDLNVMDVLLAMIFPHYEGKFTGKPYEPYKALLPNLKRFGIAADFFHPASTGELAKVVHSRGYDIDIHEDCEVMNSFVAPGCPLKEWLAAHRLEEFKVHFTDGVGFSSRAEALLKSCQDRRNDGLLFNWKMSSSATPPPLVWSRRMYDQDPVFLQFDAHREELVHRVLDD